MRSDNMKAYGIKTGQTNGLDLLSDEDKSSLRNFGQKIHNIDNKSLFKLNAGVADMLTTEQQDIVAFEIRLREAAIMKKQNIDSVRDFSPEKTYKEAEYETDPISQKYMFEERRRMHDMNESLLEKSKNIIEGTYIPMTPEDMVVAKQKGINAAWKKFLVVDDNGDSIKFNSAEIQEKFRKTYLKRLSEETGIDYTSLDNSDYSDIELDSNGFAPASQARGTLNENNNPIYGKPTNIYDPTSTISLDDYSLDEDD